MRTLFRSVLLAIVAGVAFPAEAAKNCREPVFDPLGIFECASTFTKSGSLDVGGNAGDKLQPRSKHLAWWVNTDENIKIELKNFVLYGTTTPYCPGKFTVDGKAVADPCQFTVIDKQPGWIRVNLKVDPGAVGKTIKFDIVITNNGTPYTIDPQIEIDTEHNAFFQWIEAAVVALLAAFVMLVAYGLFRLFRRRSGEAR